MEIEVESDEMSEDELRAHEQQEEERQGRIQALTITLSSKRKKAVEWRRQSGIEDEWSACEDSYEGIDDANRDTEQPVTARMQKPRSPDGGSIGVGRKSPTRSTVFLNITRPYADAAAARVADMLLPTDDRNFEIRPTPIPELAGMEGVQIPPEQLKEFRAQVQAEADRRAEAAQTRIDDWLTECLYHAEIRKVIEDCARLGTGILKGPEPVKRKRRRVSRQPEGLTLVQIDQIDPASRRVDPWNLFPDPNAGEDINAGSCVFERDRLSARQVRDLIGQPGYIEDALRECLEEGPNKVNTTDDSRRTQEDDRFEIWYYTGEITEDDFEAVYSSGEYSGKDAVKVVVSMINDRIVKIARAHLDTDDFGYDLMPWQRRCGMPWGIGVAKQIGVPQRMLNAATRNMSDNAALSAGPQIIYMEGVVQPADGVMELVPRKVWKADPHTSIDDIRKAFMTIEIPTRQAELMAIIQFALKIAEDVTGLPMLMQGNQGKAPDTVGGMELLNQNANTVLRRIARTFDDAITEPHIRRYYLWIMEYGDESEKGDFQIDARGSTSLVERDIQRQTILQMGKVVVDPRFGLDPELWAEEALRANKINPERLKLADEKKASQAEQQQQQLAAAQRLEDTKLQVKQLELQNQREIAHEGNVVKLETNKQDNATKLAIASKPEPQVAGVANW